VVVVVSVSAIALPFVDSPAASGTGDRPFDTNTFLWVVYLRSQESEYVSIFRSVYMVVIRRRIANWT